MPIKDQRIRVNDTLLLELYIRNASGPVSWSFLAPSLQDFGQQAKIYSNDKSAYFRWVPLAPQGGQSHQVTFTAESGDVSDKETIFVEVLQAGGAPQFIQPSSGRTFDNNKDSEVVVDIEVLDDDSLQVEIVEVEPLIEGGELTKKGDKKAQWRWRPTLEQISSNLRYTLHLEARDSDHEPVQHNFSIVLVADTNKDCIGEVPVIADITPENYSRIETMQDYTIRTTVTDDLGIKDAPILYYSTQEPNRNNPDVTQMIMTRFSPLGNGQYEARIPNLQLEIYETQPIYYVVSVTDNDDTRGTSCDHTIHSDVMELIAVEPIVLDRNTFCAPCSSDRQCEDGLCVGSSPSFCAKDCDSQGNCFQGECQENVVSRDGNSAPQCVPENWSCSDAPKCTNDIHEDDNDLMDTAPSFATGQLFDGQICPLDVDTYAFDLVAMTHYDFTIIGWDAAQTDLDMLLFDMEGILRGWSMSSSDVETFGYCSSTGGIHYLVIAGYEEHHAGPYIGEVRETDQVCCQDDSENEENDTFLSATELTCDSTLVSKMCPGDPDWWIISLPNASTLSLDMHCTDDSKDLDLELYSETGVLIETSANMTCSESIQVTLNGPHLYYAKVSGWTEAVYSLNCSLE